jgi:hypothetical protein
MIHLIRRVIKILVKKSRKDDYKDLLVKDGTVNNKLLGIINTYTNETFDKLSFSELVENAKYISEKHMQCMGYHSNLPICIIPVREHKDMLPGNFGDKYHGLTIPVSHSKKNIFDNIKTELNSNQNEKHILTLFDKIFNIKSSGPLIGIIMIINVEFCKKYAAEYLWFFPPYINYYGTIIHETTHAIQCISETRSHKDNDTIAIYNTELENDIINNRKNESNNKKHFINAYSLSLNEAEAFKKQHEFLMSTIETKDDILRQQVKNILKKEFYIHATHLR